eukprot:4370874-Pyramimonas_sp.AAC.1
MPPTTVAWTYSFLHPASSMTAQRPALGDATARSRQHPARGHFGHVHACGAGEGPANKDIPGSRGELS